MRLIYISEGDVSVYESQVLALLAFLKKEVEEVVLIQGYTSEDEKRALLEKHSRHPRVKTIWFKNYPVYPFFEKKRMKSIYNALKQVDGLENYILHVRSEYVGYIIKRVVKMYELDIPMLIDIRGVVYEELKYKIPLIRGKRKLLSIIQKWHFKKCYNKLFCNDEMNIKLSSVSPLINEYIRENYPKCKYEMFVHPNIASTQFEYSTESRAKIRQELGINKNDIVALCSTAGNAIWQKDYLIVEHLSKMGIKVINLSKNKLNLENVTTMTVKFTDMPAYLSAADIAVLWRDNTFMNNSASPSKFSEFAAMGLYVIHNNSVTNAINHIKESGSGILVDNIDDIKTFPTAEEFSQKRQEWIVAGKKKFSIEVLGRSYIASYKKLKKDKQHNSTNNIK